MKLKITNILILLLFSFVKIYSQNLSSEAKSLAQTAISCIDNKDYYCGLTNLEELLKNHSSEMNANQIKSIKVVLINCYSDVSLAKAKNGDPNYKEYCIKGIQLGKEINQQYDIEAFMLHYLMIVRYYLLENETLMNKWISKFNRVKNNLNVDGNDELKSVMISWSNSNIQKMKSFFDTSNSSTRYSFSLSDLISNSSTKSKTKTTYKKSSTNKIVTKVEKCCTDTNLGDKVVIYHVYTNKNEKINIYYYPHLDQWHFKNGWGEKNRGNPLCI